MDDNEKRFLEKYIQKSKKARSLLTTVKTEDGTEYALFDNGDICEILKDRKLKKVNDIVDKDNRLRKKFLSRFNNIHNSDVIIQDYSSKDRNLGNKHIIEKVELPEI